MEDANFPMEIAHQLKPGVLKKCVQGPTLCVQCVQMPTDGSQPCYTLREALGEPGDAVKTMMSAFY